MSRTSLTDTGHSRLFFFSYSKKCLPVQNEFTNVVMNVLYKKPFFFSIAGQCTFWQTKKKKEEEITGASLFQDCVPVMTCSFVQQWRNFVHLFWWSWMDNENLFFLCNARAQQATTTRGADGSASPSVWVSESPTDCWGSGLNQNHPTHQHSYDVTQMFRTEFCAFMRFSKVNYGLCLHWHMFSMKGFSSLLFIFCHCSCSIPYWP